jgi:16S rRNA (guanine(966)-N(2))-methyltransferase RsmD
MRIIAGEYKSRRLKTLPGAKTRPTSDKLRETLFNVLGTAIQGAVLADGYAGSGAVGLEALSRGAEFVYFLENHRPAVRLIEQNLKSLGLEEGCEVLSLDVCAALRILEQRGAHLDIVFLDPPYKAAEEYARALPLLGESKLLTPGARVIAEHHPKQSLNDRYGALARTRSLRHGDSVLSFYGL